MPQTHTALVELAACATGVLCLLAVTMSAPAEAQYRRVAPRVVELPPTEARGCYYYRGREYCGSYCYWEVNGKRYCQQRLRHAHSQAPVLLEDDEVVEYGLK